MSMPSTGFYLFLLTLHNGKIYVVYSVSMPSTGFYLFLLIFKEALSKELSVNALNGLLLISSYRMTLTESVILTVCQCPQRASTYFFYKESVLFGFSSSCVNALNGLLLISSERQRRQQMYSTECQCPQRASTYFF